MSEETLEVEIRPEEPEDFLSVFDINSRAFETQAEAELVEKLRSRASPVISLVAVQNQVVTGHILFTPVTVESSGPPRAAMGLGPMAVDPDHQNRGIGSALVREGLRACSEIGRSIVFVVGHPDYYPRFGFRPAPPLGLHYKQPEFDPALMVVELEPGVLAGRTGTVRYLPEFDDA